ncbi:MAG: cytosine deaminase, partial [Acetobacteraceae bacterium]
MPALLIRNVRPMGGAAVDILFDNGVIAALGPGLATPAGAVVADGTGALALPGLIEGHAHLDKPLWGGPWYRNAVGP